MQKFLALKPNLTVGISFVPDTEPRIEQIVYNTGELWVTHRRHIMPRATNAFVLRAAGLNVEDASRALDIAPVTTRAYTNRALKLLEAPTVAAGIPAAFGCGLLAITKSMDLTRALSPTEKLTLELLRDGSTISEIATQRTVAPSTVKSHLGNLRKKLGANSISSIVLAGYLAGELETEPYYDLLRDAIDELYASIQEPAQPGIDPSSLERIIDYLTPVSP